MGSTLLVIGVGGLIAVAVLLGIVAAALHAFHSFQDGDINDL